jgi:hypothetical protein
MGSRLIAGLSRWWHAREAMTPNELFQAALQLSGTPWQVVRSDFSGQPPILEIELEFNRGSQFRCPQCGQLCGVHDSSQKR